MFANGGGLPPQSPPLSFYTAQACFQKHRTINTTCFTSIIVKELFKPIMLAVHLQTGGLRPPQPPHFFKLYKAIAIVILSAKTEPIGPLSEPVIKTSCVQMGGLLRPPTPPPAFFLRRAGFLSRTLHHQQDLLRAHNCYRPVQTPSCRQSICKRGSYVPPQPPCFFKLCKATSSIILPAKTEPIWTLSEPMTKRLCLQMGGGLRRPQPHSFLFTPCRLAFKNIAPSARLASRAQLYRAFQSHHAGSPFANCGATSAPTPALL